MRTLSFCVGDVTNETILLAWLLRLEEEVDFEEEATFEEEANFKEEEREVLDTSKLDGLEDLFPLTPARSNLT